MKSASAAVFGLLLCAFLPAVASGQSAKPKKLANEISTAELADPQINGLSVLDAVQKLRPNWLRSRGRTSFRAPDNGGAGGARGACGRGSSSCSAVEETAGDTPGVILNEVKQDFEILRSIRAAEVTSLKYLSAQDATTRYGTGFEQGAIEIGTVAKH